MKSDGVVLFSNDAMPGYVYVDITQVRLVKTANSDVYDMLYIYVTSNRFTRCWMAET